MDTVLSIDFVVLITSIMAISLIVIAIWSKMLIFHVVAAGLFLYLAIVLHEQPALLIVLLTLVIVEMYLAFWKKI